MRLRAGPAAVAALLVLAGCSSPARSPQAGSSPSGLSAAAEQYLAIAKPANHRLDEAVDGFRDDSKDDLQKALADLRVEAATEQHFDHQLAALQLPPVPAGIAASLIKANQHRVRLTRDEAHASSLKDLRTYAERHGAADAAVELQVRAIRNALGLPPPES
jgi:hypothetical protein